jgi:small subunit ribosomal protein S8
MYYDLLPKIKNAIQARKDKMIVPFSRMDFSVLSVLAEHGYVKSVEKETTANGKKSVIIVRLGTKTKASRMEDFNTISKPSRHFYKDYRSLRPVRQGHGMAVLSTSKGIMTGKEAKKQKVGGEYLFEIW